MTAPSTPQIPDELRPYLDTIADRLLSGPAAVMVGSGFSKNATSPGSHPGFPDWSLLGDRLYERLHGNPPGPNERYLQVPALAHQVEADFGRPALDQMLRDFIPDLQHEPSPLHEAPFCNVWGPCAYDGFNEARKQGFGPPLGETDLASAPFVCQTAPPESNNARPPSTRPSSC